MPPSRPHHVPITAPSQLPCEVDYLMPALLTGNAVLLKPSEHASQTAAEVLELLSQAIHWGMGGDALGMGGNGRCWEAMH